MRSCCVAPGPILNHLWKNMIEDPMRKRMYLYLYLGHFVVQWKLTERCISTIIKNWKKKKRKLNFSQVKWRVGINSMHTGVSRGTQTQGSIRVWGRGGGVRNHPGCHFLPLCLAHLLSGLDCLWLSSPVHQCRWEKMALFQLLNIHIPLTCLMYRNWLAVSLLGESSLASWPGICPELSRGY